MSNSRPKLGQHWLKDEKYLNEVISAAKIKPDDIVLEIGPGQGDLTKHLVKKAKQVIAVEIDDTLAAQLAFNVQADNLRVMNSDILDFNFNDIPNGYVVVANIPYYITSKIAQILLQASNRPKRITMLIQKEVAERMAAKPGAMSVLSVGCQFYADVSLGTVVPPIAFEPPPKVDSQVVIMDVLDKPAIEVDPKKFFRLVKAGFSERRKKLRSSLAGSLRMEKDDVSEILSNANLPADSRAQELSLQQWCELYNKLYN